MATRLGDLPAVAAPEGQMPTEVLTEEEGFLLLDREARRSLGMTGAEFVKAWYAGAFDANPDTPEVMGVAMLLPFAGQGERAA